MNKYIESESVELKQKYTDSFVKEIVSFLNGNGGTIYIGVDDDGNVVGVNNTDETLKKISDCVTGQIEPNPQSEISSEIIYDANKTIIKVNIRKGIKSLYCVKKYGFSTKGCLIRIGSTCKEMTSEEIQSRYSLRFINNDYMLIAPSKYSPLSFEMLKVSLIEKGYHINENAFESTFNLKREDGSYNLLAEILSDKNMVPLIFVKFAGKDKTAISQRNDYGNTSILLGYQKIKDRLIAENICKTNTKVRPRIDEYLYDFDCANEALINMLVHNDWTITEPVVSFYNDRIVFTSHGGLPQGLSKQDFFNGVSHPRNAVLMRIFLNLGIVEHTGHGIPTIVKKYGKQAFDIHDSYIDVTIPFNKKVLDNTVDDTNVDDMFSSNLSNKEMKIVLELIKNPYETYDNLAKETEFSRRTVSRIIESLIEKNYIKRVGNNKSGFWKVIA